MSEEHKQFLKQVLQYAINHTHKETIEWLIQLHGKENMSQAEADEILNVLFIHIRRIGQRPSK